MFCDVDGIVIYQVFRMKTYGTNEYLTSFVCTTVRVH